MGLGSSTVKDEVRYVYLCVCVCVYVCVFTLHWELAGNVTVIYTTS